MTELVCTLRPHVWESRRVEVPSDEKLGRASSLCSPNQRQVRRRGSECQERNRSNWRFYLAVSSHRPPVAVQLRHQVPVTRHHLLRRCELRRPRRIRQGVHERVNLIVVGTERKVRELINETSEPKRRLRQCHRAGKELRSDGPWVAWLTDK